MSKRTKKLRAFSVDIQHTEEYTYQVDAVDEDEAEELAMSRYLNEEDPDHSEIVGSGTITNIEDTGESES